LKKKSLKCFFVEIYKDRRENWLKTEIYDHAQELDDIAEQCVHIPLAIIVKTEFASLGPCED